MNTLYSKKILGILNSAIFCQLKRTSRIWSWKKNVLLSRIERNKHRTTNHPLWSTPQILSAKISVKSFLFCLKSTQRSADYINYVLLLISLALLFQYLFQKRIIYAKLSFFSSIILSLLWGIGVERTSFL